MVALGPGGYVVGRKPIGARATGGLELHLDLETGAPALSAETIVAQSRLLFAEATSRLDGSLKLGGALGAEDLGLFQRRLEQARALGPLLGPMGIAEREMASAASYEAYLRAQEDRLEKEVLLCEVLLTPPPLEFFLSLVFQSC